jgi:RNA-directed DNA polymerase
MPPVKLNLRSENDIVNRLRLRDKKLLHTLQANKSHYFSERTIKTGEKTRKLCIAREPLRLFLQRFNVSLRRLPHPPECFGGLPRLSVKDNAAQHRNKRYVLNLDLQDFFPSVTTEHVSAALCRCGCLRKTSTILAELMTVNNELPQGFHTSPLLSVQVLTPAIEEMQALMRKHGLTLTVWIDDIAISGSESPEPLINDIERICAKHGFLLHPDKRRCAEQGVSKQVVTGVLINGDELRPANGFIRTTEKMIYTLQQYGWEHLNARFNKNFDNESKALLHLDGRLTWIKEFTPEKATKLRAKMTAYRVGKSVVSETKKTLSQNPRNISKRMAKVS